jgi:alkyl hydroperoxide reductase subunit AhpF
MLNTIFKDISPLLLKVAPTIATALGSPIAGIALQILANKFGGDVVNPAALVNTISNHPNAGHILTEAENDHASVLKSLLSDNKIKSVEMNFKVNMNDD